MVKRGVRCGAELRKRTAAISKQKTARYSCPKCGKKSVRREGNAMWKCRSCGAEFAGGAYSPSTAVGESAKRLMENIKKGVIAQSK